MRKINDEILTAVSGGVEFPGGGRGERNTREYNVGDRVEIYRFIHWFTRAATVIEKEEKNIGFMYLVRYDDGDTEWVTINDIQD